MSINPDPNKADLNFINGLQIPSAIISKNAKFVDSKGNEVLTKTVIKTLDRLVKNLQTTESKLTPQTAEKINSLQNYLTTLLQARSEGGIIPSKLSAQSLQQRQEQLTTINGLFEKALSTHNMEAPQATEWSYSDKKMSRTFEEGGAAVTLSRNADNQVKVQTHEVDPAISLTDMKSFKARVNQVDRDKARTEASKVSEFIQFADKSIEGNTALEKIGNLIKKMDAGSQDSLISELYSKLPEGSKELQDPIADLSTLYGIPEGETDKKVAILAKHVYLSSSPTTLLTSFMPLGQSINVRLDQSKLVSTLEIVQDSNGHSRPKLTAISKEPFEVKTPIERGFAATHTGNISAVCDPIKGTIEGEFVISPKEVSERRGGQ